MGDYEEGWKSCPLPRYLVGGKPCGPILSYVGISLYQAVDSRVITKQIWTDFHQRQKRVQAFFAHFSLTRPGLVVLVTRSQVDNEPGVGPVIGHCLLFVINYIAHIPVFWQGGRRLYFCSTNYKEQTETAQITPLFPLEWGEGGNYEQVLQGMENCWNYPHHPECCTWSNMYSHSAVHVHWV